MEGTIIETIQGKKISPLKLKIEENIYGTVPAGKWSCFKGTPTMKEKKEFKNQATMSILFSDDENRYPINIKMNLKYGSLTLKLKQIIN